MERFAQFVVAGGLALVAGLWMVTLFAGWSVPWLVGLVLSLGGVGSLLAGIRMEIEW